MKKKLIRVTTIPTSMTGLLTGQLRFMSNHYDVLGVASKGEDQQFAKIQKAEGIPCHAVEMTRQITPIQDLKALWKLYKLFKDKKPFIVHSHTPKAGTLAMVAAKFAGVPHRLHTIAGLPLLEATGIKRFILNTVEKITYGCASKIYPNSFGLYDIILEHKFTSKHKLKVLANGSSNGIDTTHFSPNHFNDHFKKELKNKFNITEEDSVFVFVGRLVKDKGINELVAAFTKLNVAYKTTKLMLIGDYEEDLDPLLPETLEAIQANPNIIFTGWVTDVRPYFAIANALTFPSYREGFPNVVMQAGAMELASIVTNINGCNEIIKNMESGLIIPVKDEMALLNAMTYVLEHPAETKTMGENSRQHIVSNYEQKVVWEAILREYNSL